LSEFTGRAIEEAPQVWMWEAPDKEKKKLVDHLRAIALLRDHGLRGTSVIGAYHARRVAMLMARALSLYEMVPGAPLEGTVLAHEPLCDIKVAQRIMDVTEAAPRSRDAAASGNLEFIFPIPGHPTMWSDTGFTEFISSFWFLLLPPFFDPLTP
jgi:hypothetical protein